MATLSSASLSARLLPARLLPARLAAAWLALIDAERGRAALWLAPLMAAGAVAELLARREPPVWSGAALAVLALALCWALPRPVRGLGAVTMAVALGVCAAQLATWQAPPLLDVPRRAVIVTGAVAAVETLPDSVRVTIAAPAMRLPGGAQDAPPADRAVRVHLRKTDPLRPAAGDVLRVRALLSRPSPPAYPGAWDLRRDAFFSGMGAYGFALGPAESLGRAETGAVGRLLQSAREAIATRVATALPPVEAAIAATLLTGNPSAIPEVDRAAFRDSGLAHLLAIAGLHVGIVMGLAFGLVRVAIALCEHTALRWPGKAIAGAASVAAGCGYMLLTGAHLPILRSFAMACLFTLAIATGRRALSLRALALAMAVIVLTNPSAVLGVSFQMSFSAVLALIAGYEALRPWLRRVRGGGGWRRALVVWMLGLVLTSALAGTASAPYGAYHFGRLQLYYVLANAIAVPLTAFWVMPLGLAALALMPLHGEHIVLALMGVGIDAVLWVGRSVAALPAAVIASPPIPPWGIVMISLGLAWLGIWRTRLRLAGVLALAAGVASPLTVRLPDALISADARLIGVRTAEGLAIEASSGAAAFTRDTWQQGFALPLHDMGDDPGCDATHCLLATAHGSSVWVARAPPPPAACLAGLVVAAEPVRLRCPGGAPVIDRFSVWRDGAHAVWLEPAGVHVISAHDVTGDRLWAPQPHRAGRAPGLKLAPRDEFSPE